MARVDFYLLKQAGLPSRQSFACRLAEKAYRLENTVHIHASDRASAERLDDALMHEAKAIRPGPLDEACS